MTTIHEEFSVCKICGNISRHFVLGSTNSFGAPDLDTRPAEMARSTMNEWLQVCPECGYCYEDISKGRKTFANIIKGEPYQNQLKNPDFPELANHFLCHAIQLRSIYKYEAAAWACLHAAWICDDDNKDENAIECRQKAISLFEKAKSLNPDILNEPKGSYDALIIDLQRRSGQFDLALDRYNEAKRNDPDEIIADILQSQIKLINRLDTGCYVIGEVE